MKINFSKIKQTDISSYMFLTGVVLSLVASLISSYYYNFSFLFFFIISVIFVAFTFYRSNNGLIALFFGEFGVSRFSKKKSIKYQLENQLTESQIQNILDSIQYGKKSLLVRRKDTQAYYQIIKRKNSFYIKKCPSIIKENLITDFENNKKYKGTKNVEIMFHTIKEIWYTVDADNETMFYLSNGKRKFPFVPVFPIDLNMLETFISFDGQKNDILYIETLEKDIIKRQKEKEGRFFHNIISMLGIVFMVQCIPANRPSVNYWQTVCMVIMLICLWYFVCVSFLSPERFFYYNFFKKEERNASISKSGYEKSQVLCLIFSIFSIIINYASIVDIKQVFKYSAVIFLIAIVILFPRLLKKKKKNKTEVNFHILVTCVILAITCFISTLYINNLYVTDSHLNSQTISKLEYDGEVYYTNIYVDGQEFDFTFTEQEYQSEPIIIESGRMTGLLGLEYRACYVK